MNPNDFKIVFDSDKHEVDVETLIGCLMHTSNIIQEVNRGLDTNKKIEIKIKALEAGSFEVHIELVEKIIQSLFSKDNMNYGADIVAVVGGLYAFSQFLKGKKPKSIKKNGGQVVIENIEGNTTIINNAVYNIYNENPVVRQNISKQFAVLDKNTEISAFKFESKENVTSISKDEFWEVSQSVDASDEDVTTPKIELFENKRILIVRPSFSPDLKWDFLYDGHKITAKMIDEEIVKIIDAGEPFVKGDYMLVDLERTMFYDHSYDAHIVTKDSYKIIKFKEHIKTPKQQILF